MSYEDLSLNLWRSFAHSILPYGVIESQTTWWTFSTGHDMVFYTKLLFCLQLSQGMPLLRKSQILWDFLSNLSSLLSKRHGSMKKDLWGPRLACLVKSCQMMLVALCIPPPTCVRGQSKHLELMRRGTRFLNVSSISQGSICNPLINLCTNLLFIFAKWNFWQSKAEKVRWNHE